MDSNASNLKKESKRLYEKLLAADPNAEIIEQDTPILKIALRRPTHTRRGTMLDLIIRGGQVVTSEGVAARVETLNPKVTHHHQSG